MIFLAGLVVLIAIVGGLFISNFEKTPIDVDKSLRELAAKMEAEDYARSAPEREIISLKKLPTAEDVIYDFIMNYSGLIERANTKAMSFLHGYKIRRNGEPILVLVNYGSSIRLNYSIQFDFANDFSFDHEEVKAMYQHIDKLYELEGQLQVERERRAAIAKDEAKRKAFLGTPTAKVRRA